MAIQLILVSRLQIFTIKNSFCYPKWMRKLLTICVQFYSILSVRSVRMLVSMELLQPNWNGCIKTSALGVLGKCHMIS